jgi:hypothetical protein
LKQRLFNSLHGVVLEHLSVFHAQSFALTKPKSATLTINNLNTICSYIQLSPMLHLKPAKPTGFGPFSQEFFRPNWNSAPRIQNALILGLVLCCRGNID